MLFSALVTAVALLGTGVQASKTVKPFGNSIKHLVAFGDSYTDSTHWVANNGTTWGQFLSQYTNISLHNFAISGATCDNKSTPRQFPDVTTNELGDYYAFVANKSVTLKADQTLYSLWIGTNDVGGDQLITGQQTPGVSVVNVSHCSVNWIKTLYKRGARNFLFQNMIPLDETPMYAADAYPDRYWTATRNTTQWNIMMKELIAAGNEISKLLIETLTPMLPGATVGYFDSYALFNDMYHHPERYLTQGTGPYNVTGAVNACVYATGASTSGSGACTVAAGAAKENYLWYDELHPSEATDRALAKEIQGTLAGTNKKWLTVYKGPY